MHITLRQLEIFLGVYEHLSLTKGAEALSLSVSAASQSLKELERVLGSELFRRGSSRLAPTEAAGVLLPQARLIVGKAREVEAVFAARERGLAGRLVIGANRTFGIYILSRRLPAFKRRHPAVEPSLTIEDNEVVEQAVLANTVDVGFISRPPQDPSLSSFACFRDDFVMIASPKSPYISVKATEEDFSMATWILDQEDRVRDAALKWLEAQGIAVSSVITTNTMGSIKRAVATGMGLAVMPYLSVQEEISRGDLVELRKDANPDRMSASPRLIYAVFKSDHLAALRELFFKECSIRPL